MQRLLKKHNNVPKLYQENKTPYLMITKIPSKVAYVLSEIKYY